MNSALSKLRLTALSLAAAGALLAACAGTPPPDTRLTDLQTEIATYRNNPRLVAGAPLAVSQADASIARATSLQGDAGYESALYDATQKVAIVKAQAERLNAEADVNRLDGERTQIQLDARTMEANRAAAAARAAQASAATAMSDAEAQRAAADRARMAANQARGQAADALAAADAANARNAALMQQLSELQAKQTERGVVLTLGDVVFATGRAELRPGASLRLAKLVDFLRQNPARSIAIEGHTDNVGGDAYNLRLSQARADTVRDYLVSQGVDTGRITSVGKGKNYPVADNATPSGRQANRRVEIVIANEVTITQ